MPVPTVDFLNDAVDAVVTALQQSVDFMSPNAPVQPNGATPIAHGTGVVMIVEDNLPDTTEIPSYRLPHCSVFYSSDEELHEEDSAGDSEIAIEIGIRLYNRGADRRTVQRTLLQAAAAVERVVKLQMNANGTNFDSYASNARYHGGTAIDTEEKSGYGAMQLVRLELWVTLSDY